MSKINLPSVPRSTDRDTTVFLQSLKKAVERLQVGGQTELSDGAKSYVLRIDKKTREDLVGVIGNEAGVGAILDKIRGQITESELSIHLGERIEKIISNENAITEERLQRVADVLAANQAIVDEAAARVQAITDSSNLLQQGIDAEVTARVNAISATRDEIIAERNLRVADILAANTKIEQEATARLQAVTATNTALEGETRDRIAALLEANRDITAEREARVAAIIDESSQRTTNEAIVAERISGVFAQVNPKLAGDTDGWAGDTASYVGVWSEQSARIEEDFALGTRIDTLNADFDNSNALIQSNYKVLAEADNALAIKTDVIRARTDSNEAAINTETQARTDANSALSSRIDTLSAVTGENSALITSESIARTNSDEALSSKIDTLFATTGTNTAAIQTELTARTTADSALSVRIDTLTATTGNNTAAIQTESTARTDADGALSSRIDTLVSTTGTNTASITAETIARATEDEALSSRIDTLVSTTGTNSAAIQTETQARTTADSALSSRVDTLVSTTGANTASIQSNYNALTTATSANASRIDGVYAQVNPKMAGDTDGWAGDDSPQNLVGSWTERSAIIENDLAMSKRVDGLTTEVGNNKATITEVNKTLVTKNEVVASQINRLAAQMVGGYDGNNLQDITSGLIHQERQARATETEGLAQQISLLSAGVGEQFDSFEIWHFNKSNDGWTGGVYQDGWLNVKNETLISPTITLDGSMYKHVKIRIQKFGTPTWQGVLSYAGGSVAALEPSYTEDGIALVNFYAQWAGDITSFSLKLASVADTNNYFLVDWVAVGRPSPGASHAALLREEKARADKDLAIVQDVTALNAQINGDGTSSTSSIVQKLNATATKTDTNASDISGLTSTFNTEMYSAQGIITRNAQTAASASAANASDISGVFAQVNPRMAGDTNRWAGDDDPLNGVGVWSERSARIEDGMYTAERFDAMTARVDGNAAAISTETKIRIDEIKAVAQRTDTLRTDFNANAGVVQTEIKAVADANSALSTRTDTIQSTVGEHTSSIQTQQQAIDGINARWSIKVDVNGVVGGIALGNNGSTVDFLVRAGSFAIQGQSGSKSVPFVSYPDGTVIDGVPIPAGNYLEDTYIRRASIDTLDIKGNAVTVPVSSFTESAIAVGTIYTTIQSLFVPADMGHTMLNFNAIFNFPGYARIQSILCRVVKNGVVLADNIEVFFSEARSASRATTAVDASGHNHSGSFQGSTFINGQYINIGGPVTIGYTSLGGHSHNIDVANDNRNAGSFALSRHDSTGVAGDYELQMRVSNGDTANISQRYIHAITMRR